jgi:hypothetical protein
MLVACVRSSGRDMYVLSLNYIREFDVTLPLPGSGVVGGSGVVCG